MIFEWPMLTDKTEITFYKEIALKSPRKSSLVQMREKKTSLAVRRPRFCIGFIVLFFFFRCDKNKFVLLVSTLQRKKKKNTSREARNHTDRSNEFRRSFSILHTSIRTASTRSKIILLFFRESTFRAEKPLAGRPCVRSRFGRKTFSGRRAFEDYSKTETDKI